ncbi:helix-turn-helix domain-containing protein [Kocuria flava]|uniref:helix-turn-helix transcriptional regulator n=1 Tax=Kocuria flava TaxID=446860 RepID=UPI002F93C0D9
MDEKLLTPAELAEYLHTTTGNLAQMRFQGTGPAFIKAGRKVLYAESDIRTWLAAGRRTQSGSAA